MSKKQQNFKTGSIIRIKLEHDLGFVYAMVINLTELIDDPTIHALIRVYNFITQNPSEEDIKNLHSKDLLVGPLFVLDLLPVVKKGKWPVVGHIEPVNEELIIPDFKEAWPLLTMYEDEAKEWKYIRNLDVNGRIKSTWEKVKHLEIFSYKSNDLIARRLTMEYLRQTGKKIEDYYELKEWEELSVYKNVLYTPVYSKIPKEIRGRAL
jgi:hypothetical protein